MLDVERVRRFGALDWGGAGAVLCVGASSREPDLAWFVGDAHLGSSFVVAPRGAAPRLGYLTPMDRGEAAATGLELLTPEALGVAALRESGAAEDELLAAVLERGLGRSGVAPGLVAVAGRMGAGNLLAVAKRLEARGWSFAPGHRVMRLARKTKSAGELRRARAAAAGTAAAFRAVAGILASAAERNGALVLDGRPLTVGRLRRAAARELASRELEQPEGNIFAAGAAAAVPHSRGSSDQVLRAGEALVVDLFPRGGLFADCSRTFCVGEPPEALAGAHRAVVETLEVVARQAVPGRSGWELQQAACGILEGAGYRTPTSHPGALSGFVHGIGHGVGLELHEYPSFSREAGEEGLLVAGDLLTLEPGLYDPEAGWGVRLEDTYHFGGSGLECLTPLPYELDPRAWSAE